MTGYQILRSQSSRRGDSIYKRGRKPVLAPHKRDAIKTVKDASFRFISSSYYVNVRAIGIANGSERAI